MNEKYASARKQKGNMHLLMKSQTTRTTEGLCKPGEEVMTPTAEVQ